MFVRHFLVPQGPFNRHESCSIDNIGRDLSDYLPLYIMFAANVS